MTKRAEVGVSCACLRWTGRHDLSARTSCIINSLLKAFLPTSSRYNHHHKMNSGLSCDGDDDDDNGVTVMMMIFLDCFSLNVINRK